MSRPFCFVVSDLLFGCWVCMPFRYAFLCPSANRRVSVSGFSQNGMVESRSIAWVSTMLFADDNEWRCSMIQCRMLIISVINNRFGNGIARHSVPIDDCDWIQISTMLQRTNKEWSAMIVEDCVGTLCVMMTKNQMFSVQMFSVSSSQRSSWDFAVGPTEVDILFLSFMQSFIRIFDYVLAMSGGLKLEISEFDQGTERDIAKGTDIIYCIWNTV